MDRSILEGDPHSVIEGMSLGAYAMGADEGYIYCRAEYPLAIKRLKTAIAQAEEYGLLGKNIMGTNFSFEINIKEGAGAFVCGEETALMVSIEGRRGMPNLRPPFPAESGLWKRPTNIEAFAARGYACRAMRLPGFGGTMDERRAVDAESWTRALAAEAADLRRSHDEVWAVTHSLGSAVAVRHVLQGGDGFAGLVLLAPLVAVSDKRSPILGARTWFRVLGRFVPLAEQPFPEDILKDAGPGRPELERFIPVNIYHALFRVLDDNAGRAPDLRLPVYAAVSPHDSVADPAAAEAWLRSLTGTPRQRLVHANDSAHMIPLDFDAGWITDDVIRFIRNES